MRQILFFSSIILLIVLSPGALAVVLHHYNNAPSHGGYGYLSTSETEAMADLNFDCSAAAQRLRSTVCGASLPQPGQQAITNLDRVIIQFSAD
ncbi:MAG: hypothetical protein AABY86_18125, partial [Bdellovibrionota bacterium]